MKIVEQLRQGLLSTHYSYMTQLLAVLADRVRANDWSGAAECALAMHEADKLSSALRAGKCFPPPAGLTNLWYPALECGYALQDNDDSDWMTEVKRMLVSAVDEVADVDAPACPDVATVCRG